ncbi:MAG: hypothetical protein JXJ17_04475 [Anaerolineae bacterium]|nr:hypothetical protein [Anaerolineae bacterium]
MSDGRQINGESLMQTITGFVNTEDWPAAREYLDTHPELLAEEADVLFTATIQQAESSGEDQIARLLTNHRDLLRACRAEGVEAAFADRDKQPDLFDLLAHNTIAVLTGASDRKEYWFEGVQQVNAQAKENEIAPLVALTGAILSLLMGDAPAKIDVALEGDFKACWERIVAGIGE